MTIDEMIEQLQHVKRVNEEADGETEVLVDSSIDLHGVGDVDVQSFQDYAGMSRDSGDDCVIVIQPGEVEK